LFPSLKLLPTTKKFQVQFHINFTRKINYL